MRRKRRPDALAPAVMTTGPQKTRAIHVVGAAAIARRSRPVRCARRLCRLLVHALAAGARRPALARHAGRAQQARILQIAGQGPHPRRDRRMGWRAGGLVQLRAAQRFSQARAQPCLSSRRMPRTRPGPSSAFSSRPAGAARASPQPCCARQRRRRCGLAPARSRACRPFIRKGKTLAAVFAWTGVAEMFEAAGYRPIESTTGRRALS